MSAKIEMLGRKYGRLTAVKPLEGRRWLFKCRCGVEKDIDAPSVRRGLVNSCGCLRVDVSTKRATTHGHTGSATYISWWQMHQRCSNENKDYFHRYGGRGVAVCARWASFENFLFDMGERPAGMSLDRFPNKDGNYNPGNCRWATPQQQMRNSSNNHQITFRRKTMPVCAWAEEVGISSSAILHRLKRGWSVRKALTTPIERRPGGSAQRAL